MKYNEIMPECFIDTTLVSSLLEAKVSHKHSCNEVAREMDKDAINLHHVCRRVF